MLNGYHQIKTLKNKAVLTLLGLHANDCVQCGQFQSNWVVKWKIPFSWNAPSNSKYSFIRKPAKPPTITWNETKKPQILMTTSHLFENRMYFFGRIVRPRISFAFRMKHSEAIKAVFGFSMLCIWTSAILFFLSFGLLVITIWLDDFSYGWWISSICVCFHSKKKSFFRRFSSIHAIYGK